MGEKSSRKKPYDVPGTPCGLCFGVLLLSAAPAVVALGEPRKNGKTGEAQGRSMGCSTAPCQEVLGLQKAWHW